MPEPGKITRSIQVTFPAMVTYMGQREERTIREATVTLLKDDHGFRFICQGEFWSAERSVIEEAMDEYEKAEA